MRDRKAPGIPSLGSGRGGPPREQRSRALIWLVGVVVTLLILWALHMTVWVSMPVIAAFFIALAVWPVSNWMHKHLPGWLGWLGYLAAMLVIFVALLGFALGIWYAASQVAAGLPRYEDSFQSFWDKASDFIRGVWSGAGGNGGGFKALSENTRPLENVGGFAMTIVKSIWNIVAVLVLIFFLVLLMLLEARVWQSKLSDLTDGEDTSVYRELIGDVANAFRSYLLVRTVVGFMTAGAYALWLWFWQLDFLVVWALLAFLFNFVPTVGSLIAGGLAFVFAFLQKDFATACLIGGGLLLIEQVFGNYVDPVLQGRNLSLSPLVLLFMLLLWGWVWGIPGMLLAAPLTVLIVMVTARIPALTGIALALSGEKSLADLSRRIGSDR